jgi:hypothetical protein
MSSDPSKTEPAISQHRRGDGPLPASAAADLQAAILRIAGQIGDADRRHCEALEDVQERLVQFGRHVDQARTAAPEPHAESLGRLEQEIAALSERIDAYGQQRHSPRGVGATAAAEAPAGIDEPWDAQSAEALTRIWEAEAEAAAAPQPRRTPKPGRPTPAASSAAAAAGPQAPGIDRAWLEARFAGIAALLQQSLADGNPAKSLASLGQRLGQVEERLDGLLSDVSARLGGHWLEPIEQQIKELASQLDAVGRQLARLDAIDEQLRQLARALEEHRQWSQSQPTGLRSNAEAPPSATDANARIDTLEGLMREYMAERRRSEGITSGALQTIEEALGGILDRFGAMEAHPTDAVSAGDGMEAEGERLAQAYAAGARVLGYKAAEAAGPTLDAADYVPCAHRREAEAPARPLSGAVDIRAVEATPTRQQLRASARSAAKAGGPLSPLLIGGAMVILSAAGYLTVDLLATIDPTTSAQQSIAPNPGKEQAPGVAEPASQPGE